MPKKIYSFLYDFQFEDVPNTVLANAKNSLLDLIGVAVGGTNTKLSNIIRNYSVNHFAFNQNLINASKIWFDGRSASPSGAALANAMTIDSLDAHDGQKLTKGHVGCGLIPSLISIMQAEGKNSSKLFLTNLVLGYELGTRAGISLHKNSPDYHTSGAWIALACAAVGSRILELTPEQLREALGIAEYHGPRSQMMRCIDYPTMVKDGSGWGAMSGISAAYLSKEGFTGAPAITIESENLSSIWNDIGKRWYTNEQYLKLYPVCRWAQPAVEAVLELKLKHKFKHNEIKCISIKTFHEAKRLKLKHPKTTEEAQYSLPHPVAAALILGKIGVNEVSIETLNNPKIALLREKIEIKEYKDFNNAFPHRRFAQAEIKLKNDNTFISKPTEAKGDPENPLTDKDIKNKFERFTFDSLGSKRAIELYNSIIELETHKTINRFLSLIDKPLE